MTNPSLRALLLATAALAPGCSFAAGGAVAALRTAPQSTHQTAPQSDGERVFATHCSRCHMPPATLSPRVSGTVMLHMRTRARLSRKDEELLLKYLAP